MMPLEAGLLSSIIVSALTVFKDTNRSRNNECAAGYFV
ncbi:hypothetical protein ADIARSV_2273 [Arcticibacter svalbardensis MN12-7]|uniref:Uncharacterized protein n=1 Tax=Arcticibacter svalbardensis MN12-7 TaxID=1150600 RepID=R9GT26_9SPHI|nr:hypothetical protein ADIARSV_2273 [Arcticibacter svalbardensis MN12-7]